MSFDDHVARLFTEYERQRTSVGDLQSRMRDLSASATSARREVTITVGQNGVLTDIQFPTGAYKRLASAELRSVILRTFTEAKESVLEKAAEVLAPMLPEGMDAHQMVRGEAGVDTFFPPEGPHLTSEARSMLGLAPEKP